MKCLDSACEHSNRCIRFTPKKKRGEEVFDKTPRWNNECNFFMSKSETKEEIREEIDAARREFYHDNHTQ